MSLYETLQVVWQSLTGTPRSYVVNGNVLHYLIDDELTRLTKYTVYVYAFNDRGKGSDGQRVNVTTDAVGEQLSMTQHCDVTCCTHHVQKSF